MRKLKSLRCFLLPFSACSMICLRAFFRLFALSISCSLDRYVLPSEPDSPPLSPGLEPPLSWLGTEPAGTTWPWQEKCGRRSWAWLYTCKTFLWNSCYLSYPPSTSGFLKAAGTYSIAVNQILFPAWWRAAVPILSERIMTSLFIKQKIYFGACLKGYFCAFPYLLRMRLTQLFVCEQTQKATRLSGRNIRMC